MKGKLVCFEGIDGSGKGLQIRLLRTELRKAVLLEYPDKGSFIGRILASFLKKKTALTPGEQFLLYCSDILKDQQRIRRLLEQGKTAIMDRYVFSTIAYQAASGFPMRRGISTVVELGFLKPDVTILLDINPKLSIKRKRRQEGRLEFFEREKFLEKVRQHYLALARRKRMSKRWVVLDGGRNPEELSKEILHILAKTNVY